MSKYKEVLTRWCLSLFILMIVPSLITILAFPTNLASWAFALALSISFAFSLLIGIL